MIQTLKEIRLLLVRLSIVLLAYPVCKVFFFLFNQSHFPDVSFGDLMMILFYGLRFDISALVFINLPFIAMHILPFQFTKKNGYQLLLKIVFLSVNAAAILADCLDFEYYKFTLKRTTIDFLDMIGLGSDFASMLPHYIIGYWYIVLIWVALIILIAYLYNKTSQVRIEETGRSLLEKTISWLIFNSLLVGLCVIGFRGGIQLRPIMTINASEYVPAKNIPLIVNTPFSVIKSYGLETIEEKKYFSETELKKIFFPIHEAHATRNKETKPNIFIIILESFSKEYIGSLSGKKSHTPFLDSLIKQSLVFDNAFANGKRSIDGIPAILAGMPALMSESYITSNYGSNQFTSIANTLKRNNYTSAFFHGGTNGTMGFDAFTSAAGFVKYFGRSEYNNERDYDGDWGIWDEDFFKYTEKNVNEMKEPFLAALFSLSSHHPYPIPDKYKNKFSGGELPILKSIEYADFSLRKFFESASKEKWFDNTLFVITADHTGSSDDRAYMSDAGLFKIPLLFYKHNSTFRGTDHRVAQQIDILPTVLNYLNYDKNFYAFGSNLLDSANTGYAVNYLNEVYQLFEGDHLLQFDGNDPIGLYNFQADSLLQTDLLAKEPERSKQMETKLKAIIQAYHSDMIHDKMTTEK